MYWRENTTGRYQKYLLRQNFFHRMFFCINPGHNEQKLLQFLSYVMLHLMKLKLEYSNYIVKQY